MHVHRLEVGEQHVSVLQRRLLVTEEQFCGAQPQRVVAAFEEVAQDHVRQLVDEQRRHIDRALEQAHVAAFHRAGRQQALAEPEQHAVVVARVLVPHRVDFRLGHRAARCLHERGMQAQFVFAGFLDRVDLRAQVVRAQEIVGDPQPAGRVAF